MLEYTAHITSQEPVTEATWADIQNALGMAGTSLQLASGLQQDLTTANSKIDNLAGDQEKFESASLRISNVIQKQVCDLTVYGITDSGYVDIRKRDTCPVYTGNEGPTTTMPLVPKTGQIRLTLYSDYAQLKRQVATLTSELNKLKAETRITPVANASLRKHGSTLYPQYGDWLLTSDTEEQYISFAGVSAEIGRSIYIQTRKRAYLSANGQSFFGLPSVSENQWLSKNTTYRFVRAGATDWLVTSSASPYPWT